MCFLFTLPTTTAEFGYLRLDSLSNMSVSASAGIAKHHLVAVRNSTAEQVHSLAGCPTDKESTHSHSQENIGFYKIDTVNWTQSTPGRASSESKAQMAGAFLFSRTERDE